MDQSSSSDTEESISDLVKIQDLYIPDVDEMEKEIAYLNFKIEKDAIISNQWRRLFTD